MIGRENTLEILALNVKCVFKGETFKRGRYCVFCDRRFEINDETKDLEKK